MLRRDAAIAAGLRRPTNLALCRSARFDITSAYTTAFDGPHVVFPTPSLGFSTGFLRRAA
jgi:hypothetical protein